MKYTAGLLSLALLFALAVMAPASVALAQTTPSFSKIFSPDTIGPGSISTLSFSITNPNASPVTDLAFTDSLPAGMTVASPANVISTCQGTTTATEGSGTITLSDGAVGGSNTCSISVDVTISTPGTHTNTSGVLSSSAGSGGTATADLTVVTDRPGFTKSFSPSAIFFGDRSTLTLTIDNSANTSQATNLTFTDNLPTGMVIAGPSNASTTCNGGILSAPGGGSTISYGPQFPNDATVADGSSCTVTVDVLGNAVGTLGNTTGELTSSSTGTFQAVSSGKAGATLTVTIEQIAVSKTFTDDPAAPGETVTLEFTVRNLDRRNAASNISFTDDLDAVLSGLTAIILPSQPCGAGSSLSGSSFLTLSGGQLGTEQTCTFSVTLQVPSSAPAGTYTNTTSVITADIGGQSAVGNPTTDLLSISPVPTLTKTFLDNPVGAGSSTTLEFTITNTSPDFEATDITFEDIFDSVLPTASATPADGFCGSGSTATFTPLINPIGSDAIPARLVVSGANLSAGASCTFSITLDVAVGAATGTYTNTTSEISATVGEEEVSGNPATDDLEIIAAPRLFKTFTDDPVIPGGTVTLEFTLEHDENAPGDATGISFSDDLTATLSGLTATGLPLFDVCGSGSQIDGTTALLLTGGSLSPGETCTFSVTLQVPSNAAAGSHTNTTSSLVATVLGTTVMENGGSDDLKIAGLTLTKEFTDDPTLPGGTVNLRFTIENISPVSVASAIFFRDDLDNVLDNLAATSSSVPQNDICGSGSLLSATAANTLLTFQGGSLDPGMSCTFDVTLEVPAGTNAETYSNTTASFLATIDGNTVFFDNAQDELVVASDFLMLEKEFVDDPVAPGDNVVLRFTITNLLSVQAVSNIAFTDDLDAALSGLVNAGGTLSDICGPGSQISGSSVLSFTGGELAAGGACTFNVTLAVPSDVELGTIGSNTTSEVTGTIGGILVVTGGPASDDLLIDFMTFAKSFASDATPGETVTLTFTIQNLLENASVIELAFSDDLAAVLPGLTALGLPSSDVCGEGSELAGNSFLTLSGGNLLPGGSCTFSVELQVPESAAAGDYVNVTSELFQNGLRSAAPATATLTVIEVVDVDEDGDGVLDGIDVCLGTVIPESVPIVRLGTNRYALVDGDFVFDTNPPNGGGPGETFATEDTAGCSCEQIIEALGLGNGHRRFGCSLGAMRDWVELVNP